MEVTKMRKILSLAFVLVLVLLLAFSMTGCKSGDDVMKVKSDEDASKAIADVSKNVEDVSANLQAIDKDLS